MHQYLQQTQEATKALRDCLTEFGAIDVAALRTISGSNGVSFSFDDAVDLLVHCQEWAARLNATNLSRLPKNKAQALAQRVNEIMGIAANDIKKFPATDAQATDKRRKLIERVQTLTDGFVSEAAEVLAIAAALSLDLDSFRQEISAPVEAQVHLLKQSLDTADQMKRKVDETLSALAGASRQSAVSETADCFDNEAKEHDKVALRWLIAALALWCITALMAVCSIGALGLFVWYLPETASTLGGVFWAQLLVAKAIVFGVLTAFAIWVGRTYKANRHNACVYRHRVAALSTFDRFVNGTKNERVQDAILLQASNAAFGVRQTGFETRDSDAGDNNPNVFALIDRFSAGGADH